MLYILCGDSIKSFEKSDQMVDLMLSKKPDASVLALDNENFSADKLEELIESKSLFTEKYIIKVSRPSEVAEFFEIIKDKIKEIKNSENVFIIVDPDIKKADLKKIEKYAEKVQEFNKKEKKELKENIFTLTDLLGARDTKKLWIKYTELVKETRPEEIHGILWWQIKSMNLAMNSKNLSESGLKPFVYSKSKKYAENYSAKELEKLTDDMISILYESRNSGPSLDVGLEKLILSL